MQEKTISEALYERGYIVTTKTQLPDKRLITDFEGNEIGFFRAIDAYNKLVLSPLNKNNQQNQSGNNSEVNPFV